MKFGKESLANSINNWKFGIQLTQSYTYNYPTMHTSPAFIIILKQNEIFIGPEFTKLQRNYLRWDQASKWQQENWGINLGYKYMIKSAKTKTNFFIQTCFSVYQTNFIEYQIGSPGHTEHSQIIVENTAGLGFDYHVSSRFHVFMTAGIGSTNGFFLMIDQFIPHSSLGIEYKIK